MMIFMAGSIQASITPPVLSSPPPLLRRSNNSDETRLSRPLSSVLYSTVHTSVQWNHFSTGLPEKNLTVLAAKISDPKGMALLWNHEDRNWSSGLQYHSFQDYSYWAYKPFPVFPR